MDFIQIIKTIYFDRDKGKLTYINQTLLPVQYEEIITDDYKKVCESIKKLEVRGAPAIGIAGAYALYLAVKDINRDYNEFIQILKERKREIASTRPTAVNLFWALDRMEGIAINMKETDIEKIKSALLDEADSIFKEDLEMNYKIGENGSKLINDGDNIMTICNAGALATAGYGTALAVIYSAHREDKRIHVYVPETRPLLQGARLTAWELVKSGIKATLITDNMIGSVMKNIGIDKVVVGADRISANGDTANKIGTYQLSILAKYHGVKFYVAAPSSTFDLNLKDGSEIPIEQRDREEVIRWRGVQSAPEDIEVYNPAFDVTPANNIDAIITEKGIIYPPFDKNIGLII